MAVVELVLAVLTMVDVFTIEPCCLAKADAQGTGVCPKLGPASSVSWDWDTGSPGVAGSG